MLNAIVSVYYSLEADYDKANYDAQATKIQVLSKCLNCDNFQLKLHCVNELNRLLSNVKEAYSSTKGKQHAVGEILK